MPEKIIMKTKTVTLYSYQELSPVGKEFALKTFRENNQYFDMEDAMNERLRDLLLENSITPESTPKVFASLSYSQGDGACFIGDFTWNGCTISIKHEGRYYHSNSTEIEFTETNNEDTDDKNYEVFNRTYQSICKQLEKHGYDYQEQEDSEENFIELCDLNEWTFLSDGTMDNS